MDTINPGQTTTVTLEAALTLTVMAAANSAGRMKRLSNSTGGPLVQDWFKTIPAGAAERMRAISKVDCRSNSRSTSRSRLGSPIVVRER